MDETRTKVERKKRIFFGQQFEFFEEGQPQLNLDPHWKTVTGNPVFIFPPHGTRRHWLVWSATTDSAPHVLVGEDVEQRCFAIAHGFVLQDCGR